MMLKFERRIPLTRETVAEQCRILREAGRTVGFTSGCFDILHAGHIHYLSQAKKHCDILVVGVNSDRSVRAYKGEKRPLNREQHRIEVVSQLKPVDFAFLFDELRNNINLELLRPHLYIKAGDYRETDLTSKAVVERHGGKVRILPYVSGLSTTAMIEKILATHDKRIEINGENTASIPPPHPTVFVDRDGTINKEVEYLHEEERFELLPQALEGLKRFQSMNYRIVVVTTQAGIGLGYFSKEDFYRVNRKMLRLFDQAGIVVDKIYFCPHSKRERCSCRKPEIGLIRRAEREIPADLSQSVMIGDKKADILAGKRAGLKTILVRTGHGGRDKEYEVEPDLVADDLLEAARYLERE